MAQRLGRSFLRWPRPATGDMGCFCAVPEEFYCEVLLLNESKLTLTTQQQGIKVGAGRGRVPGEARAAGRARGPAALSHADTRAGRAAGCLRAVGRRGS